ncbi:MAG: phosphonopyruvate decarboxylase [Bdellovibrionales bacterium]|nr:phosphonopyruvate decarboxylase [Bdellovibrionales bacterium]
MIHAEDFLRPASKRGFTLWTGVPCSYLTPFINSVIQNPELSYIGAASEGEAVGIATGSAMVGRKAVIICQNSGLGNTVNPLTSLNHPFRAPVLLITTHRGEPGVPDEPQHELMGEITEQLLDTMRIPHETFPQDPADCDAALERAEASMRATGLPFALVMKKGSVKDFPLAAQPRRTTRYAHEEGRLQGKFTTEPAQWAPRLDYIRAVKELLGGHSALVATTGKIGRELFTAGHGPGQLYIVGSMGCASAIGLGMHEGGSGTRHVAVLDGDGAALMKLGALATIGHYAPKHFLHIILDNEAHESTGAQPTVSSTVDFAMAASACGYAQAWRTDRLDDFRELVKKARDLSGPCLIHAKVGISTDAKLGRPTVTPKEVKEQFTQWWTGK